MILYVYLPESGSLIDQGSCSLGLLCAPSNSHCMATKTEDQIAKEELATSKVPNLPKFTSAELKDVASFDAFMYACKPVFWLHAGHTLYGSSSQNYSKSGDLRRLDIPLISGTWF
eukprot:TRINITY_DN12886_c0_g1_i1.p1 TRINITY_DN12886_c0_g1~~TRINITY_DN12886_c0_g1_i1.p1  ORF type:complete len:115 (-),score=1.82 TRINITY_DN12886_c0_g1_i1:17-361(-)